MSEKKLFKILYKYWMRFAHILGTINGYLLLSIFYFIILGLYAIPRYVFLLLYRRGDWYTTFWKKKKDRDVTLESLSNQF